MSKSLSPLLSSFIPTRSLKARLILWTMVVIGLCSALLAVYVNLVLGPGLEREMAEHQRSATAALAAQIDRQIQDRKSAVEVVALRAGLRAGNVASLQGLLNELPIFQSMFNGGSFITDAGGVVIASYPSTLSRLGVSYADRDYISQPLTTGHSIIGRPVIGRVSKAPSVAMSSPIYGAHGNLVGVLVGVIDLDQPGFLNSLRSMTSNESSSLLLVSSRDRMVVTATDPARLLEPLPAVGVNPMLDRFVAGFEGSSILVDPKGVEVLASTKGLASTDWHIVMSLPTDEVFSPSRELLRHLLAGIALFALAVVALTWQLMNRQLAPLADAAGTLARLTPDHLASGSVPPLPVTRQDEIGDLIQMFNRLIGELTRQRRELVRSETLYSTAFRTSPDAICISRLEDNVFLCVNDSFERMFGWCNDELLTGRVAGLWRRTQDRQSFVEKLKRHGRCDSFEADFVVRDGSFLTTRVVASLISLDGEPCVLSVIHDLTAHNHAQEQIETLALRDMLTGLPNRRLLMEHLRNVATDCAATGQQAALLYIGMDDFKRLKDRSGAEVSDQLLREIAADLSATVRVGDVLARLGGDEFAVVLRDLGNDPSQAQLRAIALGEAVLSCLRETAANSGVQHYGSASVGLAMMDGNNAQASDALRCADIAMSQAKIKGHDRLYIFEPAMRDHLTARALMESELRSALHTGDQFLLHFQPKVDQAGVILGAEALLRWKHPKRGAICPSKFIPVAEDCGLIVELGAWVIKEACRQLSQWQRYPSLAHLKVSVNVSSSQFEDSKFVQLVMDEIGALDIDPSRLMLELTESLLVNNIDEVISKMAALRNRGISFALDDFGTGFSSLAYLKQLPFDELKIDQSFVRDIELDPNDLAIARTVVALGASLGMAVVAEGVETKGQRDVLAGLGCGSFQGFLFSRPLPAEAFEALFNRDKSVIVYADDKAGKGPRQESSHQADLHLESTKNTFLYAS